MKSSRFTKQEMQRVFAELLQKYRIVTPVKKKDGGRFSGTDLVTYDKVSDIEEIDFNNKTHFSAKSALFPPRETLFKFKDGKTEEVMETIPPILLFLRSCDIHAFAVLDLHFLGNGGFQDLYYKKKRRNVKFVLIECIKSFENCCCVSMKTNRTSDYALFIRKTEAGFEVKVQDTELEKYFSGGAKMTVEPRFAEKNPISMELPREIDESLFNDEIWKEYSARCIACGRCNVSCPTCTCFTVQDIPEETGKSRGERRRIWSSCQVKNFALIAGGHDFRISNGDRMRYRVLHKIHDFEERTGLSMCTGCGRCKDVCPEYISMSNCADKINAIMRMRSNAHA